ncbi:MAG: glycosyltransferase family 2 protein [Candidatus Sumerlaeia bacterium]|nr:glycosyltransferase family 2 protein [Candidatus Sumerlaeia bacterium]
MNRPRSGEAKSTAPNRPLISVVTVFWNPGEELHRFLHALESCRHHAHFEVELLAVDNASQDGTAEILRTQYPWVRTLANSENLGFAEGCNVGLRAAKGDFILLLNPDCEAREEAFFHLLRMLQRHPEIGALGCTLLHGDGLPQHSHHHEPSWWSYWATHSLFSPLILKLQKLVVTSSSVLGLKLSQKPRKVAWLMGACMMIPRPAMQRVGLMDAEYFMYCEDSDYCRRLRRAGYSVVFDPRVHLVHHHGTSARRRPEFTFRRLYKSQLRYAGKHLGRWGGAGLRGAVLLDFLMRLPIYLLQGDRERLESARMVIRAFWLNQEDAIRL